jgi:two-component system, LytTR family, response regulator
MEAQRVTSEPIRTLIVDDEPVARAALRALLGQDPEIEVIGECADGNSALEELERDPPELLFLDVQMPGMDGFEVLRRLEVPELLEVVFVTAYDEYALRAFDVHAVDYLLKPFSDDRFLLALARAKRQVHQRRLGEVSNRLLTLLDSVGRSAAREAPGSPLGGQFLERLVIKSGGRVSILPVRDIDWVEAEGDYVRVHTGKLTHLLRETMKRLESQLDPARFVRIHRSTIVNVERIKELQPYFRGEYVVILHDGSSLKLARGYKEHMEATLGRAF